MHPLTQWEGVSGADLDPEPCEVPGVCEEECLGFDSPSPPEGLRKRGFMSLSFSFHPEQVPQLCPESFPFQRSIYQLQTTGLALGTFSLNGHSIPAANQVTFGKSSENR